MVHAKTPFNKTDFPTSQNTPIHRSDSGKNVLTIVLSIADNVRQENAYELGYFHP